MPGDLNPRDHLPYRARDGILETHFNGNEGVGAFFEFALDAVNKSEGRPGDYWILDTFLSDSMSEQLLDKIFRKSPPSSTVRILLANPTSPFAVARGQSIGQNAIDHSIRGLEYIQNALSRLPNKAPSSAKPGRPSGSETYQLLSHMKTQIGAINTISEHNNVELRFYSIAPSGPLYFLHDILLCGRYCAGKSAIDVPWSMVVDHPDIEGDYYEILREEFEYIWKHSTPDPTIQQHGGGESGVFLSYATENEPQAKDLKASLEKAGIDVFMASSDITPGSRWAEQIRVELLRRGELIVLLTPDSISKNWVLAELGSAWTMNKQITPATSQIGTSKIPEIAQSFQAINIDTESGRTALVDSIKKRQTTT